MRDPAELFWRHVREAAWNECWEWMASLNKGYGRFHVRRRQVLAHRWAWEFMHGPIPQGLSIDHLCRNPRCVNPFHLEPVPLSVNSRRQAGTDQGRDHCKNGHPYTDASVYMRKGIRYCRVCNSNAAKRYQERRKVSL